MTAVLLLALIPLVVQPADWFCNGEHVESVAGCIQLERRWEQVFSEKFESGLKGWKIENYRNALAIGVAGEGQTGNCLRISNENAKGDTAFEVSSPRVRVRPGAGYRFQLAWRGKVSLSHPSGHKGHFLSALQWCDSREQPLEATPFRFGSARDGWGRANLAGVVPADAASVVIRVGFDSPDLKSGEWLALDDVRFEQPMEPAVFESSGSVTSRPLRVSGDGRAVRWNAEAPGGTALKLGISGAPDVQGAPGPWSEPVPVEQWGRKEGKTHPWVRYVAKLETSDPAKTPVLKTVSVGNVTDGPWLGRDGQPPQVVAHSITRTPDAAASIWVQLADETGVDKSSVRMVLDEKDVTSDLAFAEGKFVFRPPGPLELAPKIHRIAVQARDFAGNSTQREFFLLIRPRQTSNVVSVRDDGMALVDGKPFFPIGLYSVWKKPFNNDSFDKAFGDLRAAGFNFAHTYNNRRGPDFAEFYAAAQRHGIKLFVASGEGANCKEINRVLSDVVREESQPALLAWYLADDTASHIGEDQLLAISEAIHDIDPAHITVQADGVGSPPSSRYTAYVRSTDAFLPEIYPIREDEGQKGVPQVIADMKAIAEDLKRAGAPKKTIWPIIQDFEGWGWPRFPTRAELWAMSYLAIIHGAHGITWYTYGGQGKNHGVTHTPETWRDICALASELSQLQAVLVERTPVQYTPPRILSGPEKDALGYPTISVLTKEFSGQTYLFAANSSAADVTARFPIPAAKRIELPFEHRQIQAENDGFADSFGPYAVHVYVWK